MSTLAMVCLFLAAIMALRDIEGWGWFLFAAVLVA